MSEENLDLNPEGEDLPEQIAIRLAKRERLNELNDAYPVTLPITHTIDQVRSKYPSLEIDVATGDNVALAGRVMFQRNTGKLCFATLQAGSGERIQAMLSLDKVGEEQLELYKELVDLGDHLFVEGEVITSKLTRNDSAAFSLGGGITWIFTILSSLAVLIAIYLIRKVTTKSWALMLGVALGGVTGNLIDRLTREPGFPNGHVIDFISIPFNFPIFNIADMCIFFVALFTVIRTVRGEDFGGGKAK